MTRQNKIIILISYLLILLLVVIAYRYNRAVHIKRLRTDLTRITAEQISARSAVNEVTTLSGLLPAEAGTPAFIESLYSIARETGLKQHEVTTETGKISSGSARPGGGNTSGILSKQILKISAVGSYRNFAEYVRQLQNLERFSRITDFRLTPDVSQLKGTITVELYFLPVKR